MCHPGSFPDYINLPALVSPRMTWPLTRLSPFALIFTLICRGCRDRAGQGGLLLHQERGKGLSVGILPIGAVPVTPLGSPG